MQIWVHVRTLSATSAKWSVFLPVLLISYPDMHIEALQKSWISMSCKYSMQHICAMKDLWAGAKARMSCKWRHCCLCVRNPKHIYCTQAHHILQFQVPSLGQLPFEISRTYQNFNFKLTFRLAMANYHITKLGKHARLGGSWCLVVRHMFPSQRLNRTSVWIHWLTIAHQDKLKDLGNAKTAWCHAHQPSSLGH